MNNIDLKNLRDDLRAELTAISDYQAHIDATADEKIKKTLGHIRDEEKEHFAELTKLIEELDETQKEKFAKEEI